MRRKYLFSHLAVVILTVIVLSPASYMIARNQLEKRVGEYSSIILEKSTYIWKAKVKEIIDYFLVQFGAHDIGQKLKEDMAADPELKRIRIEQSLSDIITYREGIRFIMIDSIDTKNYFSERDDVNYSSREIAELIPYDLVQDMRAKPFIQTAPDGTILFSKVIFDLHSTEYLGILTVGFDHDTFSIVFPKEKETILGNILILDRLAGQPVMVSQGGEELLDTTREDTTALVDQTDYMIEETLSDDGRWVLQSYTSLREISKLSFYAGLFIVLATSIAITAAIWFSLMLSRRESQRIGKINDYSQQIAAGDLSGHSLDTHSDELGQLSGTLEDLAHRISDLVEGLAAEKAHLDEVRYNALQFEYSALQSKINPHFLYNTLEMINAMAKLKGEREISEIVQLMAELMRDSIRRSNSLIPLREEMGYISKYLKIQDLLNENNLKIVVQVPEELDEVLVPNFILQPIVENAITHGIEALNTMKLISITAGIEDDHMVLSVTDNGVGMTEEKISAVMNKEEDETLKHTKMGLASVDRRIRIIYDQSCGIRIFSSPGEGTTVSLVMPYQKEEVNG